MKRSASIFLALITIYFNAFSQKEGLGAITSGDLRAYMTFFASDQMAGRETGTDENNTAALFIKSTLMRLGLKPVPSTGDYLQQIPLVSRKTDRKNCFIKITNDNGDIILSTDSVISLIPQVKSMEASGKVVFAGYGYEDRKSGYNDFQDLDVKGKIVMIMTRNPDAVKADSGISVFDERLESMKFASLMMRGPSVILYVYDPKNAYQDAYSSGMAGLVSQNSVSERGKSGFALPFQVLFITRRAAEEILRPTGLSLRQMQEKIEGEGKPASVEINGILASASTSVTSADIIAPNVIGIIEGTDPVMKNECIIYTAHFDHIGRNDKGEVCNGADDNASGSMALLEVAEAFTSLRKKPPRSIVFAWVNGEEKGLLGSAYYTEHPVFPMENTLLDINLDMVGRTKMESDTGKLYGYPLNVTKARELDVYTEHESPELLKIMDASSREAGIKVNDKGSKMEFGSSDHASFAAKGVPALFFNSGIHRDLHNTGDDVEKIDFDKMERSAKLTFLIGYKVAMQKERIRPETQK